jgi:hypothetical protein
MINSIDYFPIVVYGDRWNIYKINQSDNVTIDEHVAAEIDYETFEITFKETTLTAVIHELVHLHVHYCYTTSANLSVDQLEEIMAELFAHKGEQIIALAKEVQKNLTSIKFKDTV